MHLCSLLSWDPALTLWVQSMKSTVMVHTAFFALLQLVLQLGRACSQTATEQPCSTAVMNCVSALYTLLRRADIDGVLPATCSSNSLASLIYEQLHTSEFLQHLPGLCAAAADELAAQADSPSLAETMMSGSVGPVLHVGSVGRFTTHITTSEAATTTSSSSSSSQSASVRIRFFNLFKANIVSLSAILFYLFKGYAQEVPGWRRVPLLRAPAASVSATMQLAVASVRYVSQQLQLTGQPPAATAAELQHLLLEAISTLRFIAVGLKAADLTTQEHKEAAAMQGGDGGAVPDEHKGTSPEAIVTSPNFMPGLALATVTAGLSLLVAHGLQQGTHEQQPARASSRRSTHRDRSGNSSTPSSAGTDMAVGQDPVASSWRLVDQLQHLVTPNPERLFRLLGVDSKVVLWAVAGSLHMAILDGMRSVLHAHGLPLHMFVDNIQLYQQLPAEQRELDSQAHILLSSIQLHWLATMPVSSEHLTSTHAFPQKVSDNCLQGLKLLWLSGTTPSVGNSPLAALQTWELMVPLATQVLGTMQQLLQDMMLQVPGQELQGTSEQWSEASRSVAAASSSSRGRIVTSRATGRRPDDQSAAQNASNAVIRLSVSSATVSGVLAGQAAIASMLAELLGSVRMPMTEQLAELLAAGGMQQAQAATPDHPTVHVQLTPEVCISALCQLEGFVRAAAASQKPPREVWDAFTAVCCAVLNPEGSAAMTLAAAAAADGPLRRQLYSFVISTYKALAYGPAGLQYNASYCARAAAQALEVVLLADASEASSTAEQATFATQPSSEVPPAVPDTASHSALATAAAGAAEPIAAAGAAGAAPIAAIDGWHSVASLAILGRWLLRWGEQMQTPVAEREPKQIPMPIQIDMAETAGQPM